jgi:hypothetical protein
MIYQESCLEGVLLEKQVFAVEMCAVRVAVL